MTLFAPSRRMPRDVSRSAVIAASTLLLGGCALAPPLTTARDVPTPPAAVRGAACSQPTPASTYVPVPVSPDSMAAYTSAVAAAALDDAMANARAMAAYHQCLVRGDTL